MKYKITHETTYHGTEPVSVCHNQSWLKPRQLAHQSCNNFSLTISPDPSVESVHDDCFGNHVNNFSFNQGYQTLRVTAVSDVTVTARIVPKELAPGWEQLVRQLPNDRSEAGLAAYQKSFQSPRIRTNPEFAEYARISFLPDTDILSASTDITKRIHEDFKFDNRATTVTTPVEEVFRTRKGVCQDFAHLQIALLRSLKIPVRYVSGYLRTIPPPGKPRLVGVDASHAWLAVYCGNELGWIDFDPTNNVIPQTDHITIAWGRDYSDVPPLRGVFLGGGSHSLTVSVDVAPVLEPRQVMSLPQAT